MGQSSAAGLLSAPQKDEFCTCARHFTKGKRSPSATPGEAAAAAEASAEAAAQGAEAAATQDPEAPQRQVSSNSVGQNEEGGGSGKGTPKSTPRGSTGGAAAKKNQPPQPQEELIPGLAAAAASLRHLSSLGDVVGRTGGFSTFQQPQEVEFRDADSNTVAFVRDSKGKVDFYSNGNLRLKALSSVRAEGLTLHAEGEPNGPWPGVEIVTVPEAHGPTADSLKPAPSVAEVLARLDRGGREDDAWEDGAEARAIVRRVLTICGQPDERLPLDGLKLSPRGKEPKSSPGGKEAAGVDMTPDGFRVLSTQHMELRKEKQSRRDTFVATDGKYFFFDATSFPEFKIPEGSVQVEQWRFGSMVWSGTVCLFEGTDGLHDRLAPKCTARGCRWPKAKAGQYQWRVDDVVFVLGFHLDKKYFPGAGYKDNVVAYETRLGCEPPDESTLVNQGDDESEA